MGKVIKLHNDTYIANDRYSFDETPIGVWVNGKTLYRKVIYCGWLPSSNSRKNIAHNIKNIDTITNLYGIMYKNAGGSNLICVPIPYLVPSAAELEYEVGLETVNSTNVIIWVGNNRSSFEAFVILEYTKQ